MVYKKRYINTNTIFMKNLLYFFVISTALIFLFGCNAKEKKQKTSIDLNCPRIFFSSEHSNYIDTEDQKINLDNLAYKANLNNFAYNHSCTKLNNLFIYPLDILIIIEPILLNQPDIILPVYVALLDKKNNLIETQFFSIEGVVDQTKDRKTFVETAIVNKLEIITNKDFVDSIIIGFMLDKEKLGIIN